MRSGRDGKPDEAIKLASYDPVWVVKFEAERVLLAGAIGEWVTSGIHHVGSTAVPGLEAKPTVDILVGVESLEGSRACFEPLAKLDYLYAPYRPEEMHWFCKPSPSRREFHLHLVPTGSARFRNELAFRDRLRVDAGLAREYAELKRSLAARFQNDREGYTEGKGDFVARVLGLNG